MKKIDASEILQKIEKGEPIKYDHYIIEGNLDISKLDLKSEKNEMISLADREDLFEEKPVELEELEEYYAYAQNLKLVTSSIQISNSIIKNTLNFKYGKFIKEVIFSNCNFEDRIFCIGSNFYHLYIKNSIFKSGDFRFCCFLNETEFTDVTFNAKVSFKWCAFLGKSNFTKITFNNSSNFCGAYFMDIDFSEATFKIADFSNTFFKHVSNFGQFYLIDKGAKFYGSANFQGAKFNEDIEFHGVYFHDSANFKDARFKGFVNFRSTIFKKIADFSKAEFFSAITFSNSAFKDAVSFINSKFFNSSDFRSVKFRGAADFSNVTFKGKTTFEGGPYLKYIFYRFFYSLHPAETTESNEQFLMLYDSRTIFNGPAYFYGSSFDEVDFAGTQFKNVSTLYAAKFTKGFTFKNTMFRHPCSEERACRKGKKENESEGNKEEADHYHYREMAAKRRQKRSFIRYLEYPFIQLILGYGVHPARLIISWIIIIISFGLIFYWIENGVTEAAEFYIKFFDYFKLSFSTSIAPGTIASVLNSKNADYSRAYQVAVMIEAMFGTFLWSCLIATFARKYMR